MILQALCSYYERMCLDEDSGMPALGYSQANISYGLMLNTEGELVNVIDLRTNDKKPKPRKMLVPAAVTKASGVSSNFLWENTSYIFGADSKGKAERSTECLAACSKLHEEVATTSSSPMLKAVSSFLQNSGPDLFQTLPERFGLPPCADMFGENFIFIDEEAEPVHKNLEVHTAWMQMRQSDTQEKNNATRCLISGKLASTARIHPKIKGVSGAQQVGAAIVSFNANAFISFGKEQSHNAPISENAAFAYTTALNYLLERKNKRFIKIADTSTIFWAERPSLAEDVFAAMLGALPSYGDTEDDPHATGIISSFLKSMCNGMSIEKALPELDPEVRFYILGLAPNNSRLAPRFWYVSSFGELYRRVQQHAEDMSIQPQYSKQPLYPAIWQLLLESAARGKSENVPPQLAGALTRSVLTGQPYPESFYNAIIGRIRADKEVTYMRAAILKACITRKNNKSPQQTEREVSYMLDLERADAPYRLGRLFAVLEKLQIDALGTDLNSTIRTRYLGSASATPAIVFPVLMRLSQHHWGKLENKGGKINTDRRIQEVLSTVERFPSTLNLTEQGEFFLGYYHQRNDLYKKAEPTDTAADATNETNAVKE